jgi:superfamily II RNA helicase
MTETPPRSPRPLQSDRPASSPAPPPPSPAPADGAARPSLLARLPPPGTTDPEAILAAFLDWAADAGFELYPAQEEALLELMAGKHVVLNTPTGSGKSLVALGLHFKALAEGKTSYYTSPIKALASEKFFALCDDFGAENVGMMTGDASINPEAPIVCCTAEVLANRALREGDRLPVPYVVMDEFHYYSDAERGVAWQVPLLVLPHTRFLLMSATLGDTSAIQEHLKKRTGIEVAHVTSEHRPVPLDFEYRESPLHETIEDLLATGKAPVYVVNFTQRECAELAQALTSAKVADREGRERIREAIGGFRFDTPYGKEIRRFLGFGIGVHHAGLLPKYRLLTEQLSQQGLLRVIAGTDTLGVGVNIPIRTVLFTQLAKYDGKKVSILSVRDFKQIAGRAGRKGFDTQGSVVAQAPEHVIEKRRAAKSGKKVAARAPAKGEVSWNEETFEKLRTRPPETLKSRFRITHGMVLNLIQRDAEQDDPNLRNFDSLRDLIARSHEEEGAKTRLLAQAAVLVRALFRAGILRMTRDVSGRYLWVVVAEDLQWDFSLHQALSLYLVEALAAVEKESETYVLDVITLVESVLENPEIVLRKQIDKIKGELVAQMKADGIPYEERMERLEEVTHPKPLVEFIYGTFAAFRHKHPWVGGEDIKPKSIGRELFEEYLSFGDYIKRYGLQRSEGVLLRYLSQLYKTLDQSVPEPAKTDGIWDALGYIRALVETTDSSLLEEWEGLLHPEILVRTREREKAREVLWLQELLADPKTFTARVRAETHLLVRSLSLKEWEEATTLVHPTSDDPRHRWDAERFEQTMAPFFAEYGELLFTPEARRHSWTQLRKTGDRTWAVAHTLLDPKGDNLWAVQGTIDLRNPDEAEGPIVRLEKVGA